MKRNGNEKTEQLKHLSLKVEEVTTKSLAMTEKKEKNKMSDNLYIPTIEIYLQQSSWYLLYKSI